MGTPVSNVHTSDSFALKGTGGGQSEPITHSMLTPNWSCFEDLLKHVPDLCPKSVITTAVSTYDENQKP